jgi:prophage maintenance system killer protein
MTIDERLDRLTERHEALTQSMELTRIQQAEDAENIRKLVRIAEITFDSIRANHPLINGL